MTGNLSLVGRGAVTDMHKHWAGRTGNTRFRSRFGARPLDPSSQFHIQDFTLLVLIIYFVVLSKHTSVISPKTLRLVAHITLVVYLTYSVTFEGFCDARMVGTALGTTGISPKLR